MSRIDYPRAFYFLAGCVIGCGFDHVLTKLFGG